MLEELSRRHDEYVERVSPRRSPRTLRWYTDTFRVWRAFLSDGGLRTAESLHLRIQDLDAWVDWNLRRGVSHIGANAYWRGLRGFFKDWEEYDGAPNPYRTHKAPQFQPSAPKALTRDECARILLAATNYRRWTPFQRARAAALMGVMLYAGHRKAEALALTNNDVDFTRGEVHVTHGKGSWGGKMRHVPISAELGRLLQAYIRERSRLLRTDAAPEFFSAMTHVGGIGQGAVGLIVERLKVASGVRFSAHMLRHSFVTHLLRSGVPLYVARDLAGHSHIETTLGYTKVFAEDRKDGVRKLSFV